MRDLLEAVARIWPKDTTLLVHGETGTGKQLIASLVHDHSNRSSASPVTFNIGREAKMAERSTSAGERRSRSLPKRSP
jgi:DNA-binding NtrC family response regulator